jgi:putative component of toxin-antitoxin plasmid stabilization module
MFSTRPLPGFTAWIDGLKDETVRGVVLARIKRLEQGLMGDVSPVGDGVLELRISGRGLAYLFHTARPGDHRAACRRFETDTESRHQACQGIGRFA